MADAAHEKLEIGGIIVGCHCTLVIAKIANVGNVADFFQEDLKRV
jgi:hypothetical protein